MKYKGLAVTSPFALGGSSRITVITAYYFDNHYDSNFVVNKINCHIIQSLDLFTMNEGACTVSVVHRPVCQGAGAMRENRLMTPSVSKNRRSGGSWDQMRTTDQSTMM